MADIFTKEKRSQIMSSIKSQNTDIEIILRKALYVAGFRYRIKSNLFGKPDIIIAKYKVVIFCDGDFWHGRTYKKDSKNYSPFWQEKIKKNIKRDKIVTNHLTRAGWKVLRFWKSEIKKTPLTCIEAVRNVVKESGKISG